MTTVAQITAAIADRHAALDALHAEIAADAEGLALLSGNGEGFEDAHAALAAKQARLSTLADVIGALGGHLAVAHEREGAAQ